MTDDRDPDDELLDTLARAAARADAPPAAWLDDARAVYSWRTIDAELAELAYDSADVTPEAAGVRGGGGPRQLSFVAGEREVEVEVDVDADSGHMRLLGQIVPPVPLVVRAVLADGSTVPGVADDLGRFRFDDLPARAVSLLVGDDQPVKTGWIVP